MYNYLVSTLQAFPLVVFSTFFKYYTGRKKLKSELPGKRERGRPERRFMVIVFGLVREDMQVVGSGTTEEDTEDRKEMDGPLWRPLTGAAERR